MESGFDEGRVVLFYVEGGEEFNERVVRDQILHCVESIWIWNWSAKPNTWKASLDHFELVFSACTDTINPIGLPCCKCMILIAF